MDTVLWFSLIAVLISGLSLGWNIYRDVIIKPRMSVDIAFGALIQSSRGNGTTLITSKTNPRDGAFIVMTGTNHGPGQIRCTTVTTRTSDDKGGKIPTFMFHDDTHPISDPLPHNVEPGQCIHLVFPYDTEGFLSKPIKRIGIKDSFDRTHWAPRKSLMQMKKRCSEDYISQHEAPSDAAARRE